jgi:hypothetical protein
LATVDEADEADAAGGDDVADEVEVLDPDVTDFAQSAINFVPSEIKDASISVSSTVLGESTGNIATISFSPNDQLSPIGG